MIPRYGRQICFLVLVWNRVVAALPDWPDSPHGLREFPRQLDVYAKDNFGFRDQLVGVYSTLRYLVRSPTSEQVTFGRNGWLYYTSDEIFEQSRGQIFRAGRVNDFVDIVARLNELIAARGGRMIVALPPNPHSVATEHLPSWALRFEGPSEYNAILEMLTRRNVAAVDLRPALEEGKVIGPVYRPRNTHWTSLGALLAFNAVAAKLDHRDWIIDPAEVLKGTKADHGDLAAMLGVADMAPDINTSLDLSNYEPDRAVTENFDDFSHQPSYAVETSNSGETVLVMGDSYSRKIMKGYFTARAGRLVWTHFRWCGFDWSLIEENLPATVIVMPAERYALCWEGKKPLNFPAPRVERH